MTSAGDYDNDGDIDLFVPRRGRALLFHNNDGTFTEVASRSGELETLKAQLFAGGWADLDLNRYLDLVVSSVDRPLFILLNSGDGQFVDMTERLTLTGISRRATGIAFGDCDNDGDPDILVNIERGRAFIIYNSIPRKGRCYLKVRPKGRGVIGTIVRLYDSNGRPVGVREISGQTNCGSQDTPEALFAVTEGEYEVSVMFSDGELLRKRVEVSPPGVTIDVENR